MKIKEYLKKVITKEQYDIWIEPIIELMAEETEKPILIVPNIYFKSKILEILKAQKLPAIITIHKQQELKVTEQKLTQIRQPLGTKNLQMEKPYGKEKVATSEIINPKFFKYPNDARKYSMTEITLSDQKYIVHRGKKSPDPNEEPVGQLDTNHLRILLAIIHIWQEQNCKFLGINAVVKISFSIREIAKKIGYKISGQNMIWLQQKVEELTKYPITLERKSDGKANSFTFISELTTQTEKRNNRKSTIVLTLNLMLSKQLYERQVILRNKDCYKIKNPTALKFLLTYDKQIYASQEQFRLSLEEIAEELEIRGKTKNIIQSIEKVIKNLNGYKITESEEIALELVKEGRERYLVVGKRDIVPTLHVTTSSGSSKYLTQ
ncbi:MAG: hypothetical protein LBD56_00205 [Endomicrobium sp.]|jgi:hypothetical protein|nr:hypothetical protein [Endomicrobium sp.]